MKSFDAFARPNQEFAVKTNFGGYLSVASIVLVITLFFSELWYFMQAETKHNMVIDQDQDKKTLNMTLDITFPKVPCVSLVLNLQDGKKENAMHVGSEILKTRLNAAGKPIGPKVRDSLMNICRTNQELIDSGSKHDSTRIDHSTSRIRCPSCFQGEEEEDNCCHTCEDVLKAFTSRGLQVPSGYVFGQCVQEAYRDIDHKPQEQEGCRIEATIHIRKVNGALQIGVPRHFPAELYGKDWADKLVKSNFDHTINALTFGPDFPGLVHVLDGRVKRGHPDTEGSEHHQYDVHVIPTRYSEYGNDIVSHQYSVTEYMKEVTTKELTWEVPHVGLAMSYDFTAFEVQVVKSRRSLWHFLTECCAILGGILAFSGMVDNFAFQFNKSARRGGGSIEMFSRA